MKPCGDDTYLIDDTGDILPALAWAADLTIDQVKTKIDEMKDKGMTSEQMFDHFSALAALQGNTLVKVPDEAEAKSLS